MAQEREAQLQGLLLLTRPFLFLPLVYNCRLSALNEIAAHDAYDKVSPAYFF